MLLSDREWREFSFKDIGIKTMNSKAYHSDEVIEQTKGIVYVTRTGKNNGLTAIVKNKAHYKITPKNTMSYGAENADFFYHPYNYITGNKMYYLSSNSFNKYLCLFLKMIFSNSVNDCFSFGYGMIPARLMRKKFLLPINSDNNPDYAFMEAYAKEQESKKKQEYINYVKKIIEKLEYKETLPLNEKKWGEFFIGGEDGIFTISSGKRLTKAEMDIGNIPFIGATDSNNGITNWVSTTNSTLDNNVLGVNYNGSVVENFYHSYKCIFSDDVKRLHLKNVNDDKYIFLFLKTVILKQKSKYTYGYKFNANRMERQKILIPVNGNGQPDYNYMEQYAKNIEYKKLSEYLTYINN